jgi:peptidoglycan/LPS O-acetylase OafA/YrhL
MRTTKYRSDLDGIRGLAIFSVVSYHAFPSLFPGGFVGVDVFFVLSGYLISSLLYTGLQSASGFSFLEFYSHRARRIFPALALVLACSLFAGWFVLLPYELKQLGKSVAGGAGFAQNFLLWQEAGYLDTAVELKPLMHLWSLAIEEQFYLVFPPLLWLIWKFEKRIGVILIAIIVTSFTANMVEIHHNPTMAFFFPQFRLWQLLAGATLAWFVSKKPEPPHGPIPPGLISLMGLGLICFAVFRLSPGMSYPNEYALAPALGTVLLIAAGEQAWVNRALLSRRPVVWLGLISYSLYLWHWPLLSFVHIVESAMPSATFRLGLVLVAVALSSATTLWIEAPIRFDPRRRTAKAIGVTSLMALIGFSGYLFFVKNGFPSRFPDDPHLTQIQHLLDNDQHNCEKVFPDWPKEPFVNCFFQTETPPTTLLIGDSKARQLYSGLRQLTDDKHGVAVLPASCAAPFFDVSAATSNPMSRELRNDNWRLINSAINYAINHEAVKTVILAHNPDCSADDAIDMENPGDANSWNVLKNGMRRTLSLLLRHQKKVILVLDNPKKSMDAEICQWRPVRLPNYVATPCFIPRKEDPAHKTYRSLVREVLQDYPQVKTFDLMAAMCDEQQCPMVRDQRFLYMDPMHLSIYGSEYVAKPLRELISE